MTDKDHPGDPAAEPAVEARQLLEFVSEARDAVAVPAGSVLFQEGEHCRGAYFVEHGELDLTIASGSRRLKLGSALPGNLLGLSSVVSNSEYQCSAKAASDSRVIFVPAEEMREFLQTHAEICLNATQQLGAELLDLSEKAIRPLRLQPRYPKPQ